MGVSGTQLGRVAHVIDRVRSNRHVIRFVASEAHHPVRVTTAFRAYTQAIARQDALFLRQAVDDVTDAMRHANASSLVVDRLVRRGVKADVAGEFMRRLGRAHERDSKLTGLHRAFSEAMDLHNNELGISVAIDHAARGASGRAGEQALEGAVLRAIADGRALVLDAKTLPPRPSTAVDLHAVLRHPVPAP